MKLRGLRLATQFLTRLPVPGVDNFSPRELSQSAAWFPLVGLVLGTIVAAVMFACAHRAGVHGGTVELLGRSSPVGLFGHNPLVELLGHNTPIELFAHTAPVGPLGAALALLAWVWLTGALHLDGLADLSDALAAAHRDPKRFLAVLADPHIGTFGVVSIVMVLVLKFAALSLLPGASLPAVPLILAWARLGPLAWSRWLPPLKEGQGERFAWQLHAGWIVAWAAILLTLSAVVAPVLCLAPIALAGWGLWLKIRLGGMTGDCLGAGIEVTETLLLWTLTLTSGAAVALP